MCPPEADWHMTILWNQTVGQQMCIITINEMLATDVNFQFVRV